MHRVQVELGFFSFTAITDPDAHRAYNEWHQLDHLPEQYAIPGVAYGERWVATPSCRAARAVGDDALALTDYVTLYLMGGPVDETLARFYELAKTLQRAGRFFEERRALLSGPFPIEATAAAPAALVSPAVVPMRPNRGVYVVVEEAPPPGDPDVVLHAVLGVPGVAGAWTFRSSSAPNALGETLGDRRVTVAWLDRPPLSVADGLSDLVGGGLFPGRVALAGPFEAIAPWSWDWFDRAPR